MAEKLTVMIGDIDSSLEKVIKVNISNPAEGSADLYGAGVMQTKQYMQTALNSSKIAEVKAGEVIGYVDEAKSYRDQAREIADPSGQAYYQQIAANTDAIVNLQNYTLKSKKTLFSNSVSVTSGSRLSNVTNILNAQIEPSTKYVFKVADGGRNIFSKVAVYENYTDGTRKSVGTYDSNTDITLTSAGNVQYFSLYTPNAASSSGTITISAEKEVFQPNSLGFRLEKVESSVDQVVGMETPWSDLRWNAVGDSITHQHLYMDKVKELLGISFTNYGIASCTIAKNDRYLVNQSIVERVCGLNGNTPIVDADLWSIMGGLNDCLYSTPLGELQPIGSSYDITTLYGAMQKTVEYILNLKANQKLILIAPTQSIRDGWSAATYPTTMKKIREVFVEVGKFYSVPVIDAGAECGISMYNIQKASNPTTVDGVHPNALGGTMLGVCVAKKIEEVGRFVY